VQPGAHLRLGEGGRFRGQPQQPGGLGVHRDLACVRVPLPQAGREGGEDLPHGGQGLTSAHCPTLRKGDRTMPLMRYVGIRP
jgi:hypothetical protein